MWKKIRQKDQFDDVPGRKMKQFAPRLSIIVSASAVARFSSGFEGKASRCFRSRVGGGSSRGAVSSRHENGSRRGSEQFSMKTEAKDAIV